MKTLVLKYLKLKYFSYKIIANYKINIKRYKYNFYKASKNHNINDCSKTPNCDVWTYKKAIYQYITKNYYAI